MSWRWILNGKINGKGKEYYYNGKLKFEGENDGMEKDIIKKLKLILK